MYRPIGRYRRSKHKINDILKIRGRYAAATTCPNPDFAQTTPPCVANGRGVLGVFGPRFQSLRKTLSRKKRAIWQRSCYDQWSRMVSENNHYSVQNASLASTLACNCIASVCLYPCPNKAIMQAGCYQARNLGGGVMRNKGHASPPPPNSPTFSIWNYFFQIWSCFFSSQ